MATRVLHLLGRNADYQTRTAVAQISRRGSHEVMTISRDVLRRLRSTSREFDCVHAWGMETLRVAAFTSSRPIFFSTSRFPNKLDRRWFNAIGAVRRMEIICPTDTIRRAIVTSGFPISRCHLIRPGIDFGSVRRDGAIGLRAALGYLPSDRVILAMGESVRGANHHASILVAAVLNVLDPSYKLLLWGKGDQTDSEIRYADKMLPRDYVTFATKKLSDEMTFESLTGVADVALITADAPIPTLPIVACMAGAVPIVATVSLTVAELLEDRHTALMVGKPTARIIARRVLDLFEDESLGRKLKDAARAEAYEFYTASKFVEQHERVYAKMTNEILVGKSE